MPDPEPDQEEQSEELTPNRSNDDDESYSNPVDLIPADEIHQYQNHPLASSDRWHQQQQQQSLQQQQQQQSHNQIKTKPPLSTSMHQHQLSNHSFDENYSNPVDLIHSTGESSHKASVNVQRQTGSFGRDNSRDIDQIYHLPVAQGGDVAAAASRPNHLDIRGRYAKIK